tara:strand:- start:273 stop:1112 length:840 start_codon:yes stop_codon:yes gene_type:complete
MIIRFFILSSLTLLLSCDFVSEGSSKNIARYGDNYLSVHELLTLMGDFDKVDSIGLANNIINSWAIEKILIERAELNLDENKLEKIRLLVEDYRQNMLSEAYLEALVNSSLNVEIDSAEIQDFYNFNKSLFNLNEDIFKYVYVELPIDFSDIYSIRSRLKRLNKNDKIFLDSISYRFKRYSMSADKWITEKDLFQKFSFLTDYSYRSLKNYNFFQFKDSLSLYLIKIIEFEQKGENAPLDYVSPTLEYMSLNKRKKELMLKIKNDILQDAIKGNKLDIF